MLFQVICWETYRHDVVESDLMYLSQLLENIDIPRLDLLEALYKDVDVTSTWVVSPLWDVLLYFKVDIEALQQCVVKD